MNNNSNISLYLWSSINKFGGILIAFLLNFVLARFFLSPVDFGLIGMINIFISIANTTVIAGFGQAIIQRNEITSDDCNTTFTFNLTVAILLYVVLFLTAPLIASIYNEPRLINIIRVLAIVLIINGFFIVQNGLLIRGLQFRKLAIMTNSSMFISGLIAVYVAYKGHGVWALVTNTLLGTLFQAVFLWIVTEQKVKLGFNKESFRKLFSFGGFMYISSLIQTTYDNVLYLIIGKRFSPTQLGYYTQAEKLNSVPITTIGNVVNDVTFPQFSKLQNSPLEITASYEKINSWLSFLTTVLLGYLFVIAHPIILILLTDKWEPSVFIFQVLSIATIFTPLSSTAISVIKSLGRAKAVFRVQLYSKISALILLIGASFISFNALLYSVCIINALIYLTNVAVVGHLIPISIIKTFFTPFIKAVPVVIAAVISLFITPIITTSLWGQLLISSLIFIPIVIVIPLITGDNDIKYVLALFKQIIQRFKGKKIRSNEY